jgi:hypothetical protein
VYLNIPFTLHKAFQPPCKSCGPVLAKSVEESRRKASVDTTPIGCGCYIEARTYFALSGAVGGLGKVVEDVLRSTGV